MSRFFRLPHPKIILDQRSGRSSGNPPPFKIRGCATAGSPHIVLVPAPTLTGNSPTERTGSPLAGRTLLSVGSPYAWLLTLKEPIHPAITSLVNVLLFAMRFMMSGGAVTCPIRHTFRQPARGSRLGEVQARIIQVAGTKACETLLLVAHSPADDTEVLKQSN